MRSSKVVIILLTLNMLLSIAALADDGKTSVTDTGAGSRWARVDLTQYCGRTVGELLDTLGNDYKKCWCGGEPLWGIGCTFEFNDGEIQLVPHVYKYIHPDSSDYDNYYDPVAKEGPWDLDAFKKETIGNMELTIRSSESGSLLPIATGGKRQKGFGLDYAGYIGATIDSLVKDIGYPTVSSNTVTGSGKYLSCLLRYPNHVAIEAGLETFIPIPADITDASLVTNNVLRQTINDLVIRVGCRGEESPGTNDGGTLGKRECDATVPLLDTSNIARTPQNSGGKQIEGYPIARDIRRHGEKIRELIRRTTEYNRNHGTSCIGTLVISQRLDDTLFFHYFYDIGGNYYEMGGRHGRYSSFTKVVAIVHTHAGCADPTPADIYVFARGVLGPVVIIVDTNDNGLSIMRYADVKTARAYVSYNNQETIEDKCGDPLNPTLSCDRRLELIRGFFDTENTGIGYMHVPDWLEWIK